jgi:hypothetical protein
MKPQKRGPDRKPKYQPNAEETAALKKYFLRRGKETAPRMKVENTAQGTSVSTDHPDNQLGNLLLMEALGTADYDFFHGLLLQLSNGSSRGDKVDERLLNFMLSVIKGIKPRDQIEIMLAAQMAAIHDAIMTCTERLADAKAIQWQDSAGRTLNKLSRTFATQMEALTRYRTGGEQKVTVQQVSVSEGGQAIVGNVTQAAREAAPEQAATAPRLVPFDRRPTMPITEHEGKREPIPVGRKTPMAPSKK